MNKKIHTFKTFIVFFILFCSSFLILSTTGKSALLDQIYISTPYVEIEYDPVVLEQPVIPYAEPTELPIQIKTKIIGSTADIIEDFLIGSFLVVSLSIDNVPEGCYASINPPFVRYTSISNEYLVANATISFTIDQNLPAFSIKTVILNASVRKEDALVGRGGPLGRAVLVEDVTYHFPLGFMVGYQSQLSFSYPEKNVKNIGPGDTAVFPIEIENWGNALSNIKIEVDDVPKSWQASIVDSLSLATNLFGDDAKGTIPLSVKPPIDFGYREDREIITVKLTPTTRSENILFEGEPHFLYFIVQSKGVSTALQSGSEMIIFALAAILILFFIIYLIYNRKIINNYKKDFGGKNS